MLFFMIDAMEGREVVTAKIPGSFLQTDYDKRDININLEVAIFALLKEIDTGFYKYFIYTYKRGRKCMFSETKKDVYGTLEASLLFWGNFQKY